MKAAQRLAENRRKQRELAGRHQEIGRKFQAFAAPHRKACDDKLRHEAFGPFLTVERAHSKAQAAQASVLKELEVLRKEHEALLGELDREAGQEPTPALEPEPELELDAKTDSAEADGLPELEL